MQQRVQQKNVAVRPLQVRLRTAGYGMRLPKLWRQDYEEEQHEETHAET